MKYSLLFFFLLVFSFHHTLAQPAINYLHGPSMQKQLALKIDCNKQRYKPGEKIRITYSLENISDSVQKILIDDLSGYPIGVGVNIKNQGDTSIVELSTRSTLIAQIPTQKDLKRGVKTLRPRQKIRRNLILQEIPLFKKGISYPDLPPGQYWIDMYYFMSVSNTIIIKIEKGYSDIS